MTITADMQNMASWDSTADNAAGTKGCYILDAGDYYFTIGNGALEAVNNVLAAEDQSVDGSADKAKSWNDWMLRDVAPKGNAICNTEALTVNLDFATRHRITGTPTLIFEDGSRVPGAIGAAQVEERLAKR